MNSEELIALNNNPGSFSHEERAGIVDRAIQQQVLRLEEPGVREAILVNACLQSISVLFSFREEDRRIGLRAKAFVESTIILS
jgi:hypothetical protein